MTTSIPNGMNHSPRPLNPIKQSPLAKQQRGAATLVLATTLLFLMTLIILHTSQVSIVEQRVSSNHYQRSQAFSTAQTGLTLTYETLDKTLIQRFNQPKNNHLVGNIPSNTLPDNSHQTVGTFHIDFKSITSNDNNRLRITSQGKSLDNLAVQRVEQIVDFTPYLKEMPSAALITYHQTNIGGNVHIINARFRQHIAVWAGGSINLSTHGPATLSTRDDQTDSIVEKDARLSELDQSTFFANFFSFSEDAVKHSTQQVDCPTTCNSAHLDHLTGTIWVHGNLTIDSQLKLGSPQHPVLLIIDGKLNINHARAHINGLVYTTTDWHNKNGAGKVTGMVIVRGTFSGNGHFTIEYDSDIIASLVKNQGRYLPIPGTWRDF